MRIEDCDPSLRQRIEQQITLDRAVEQQRRLAEAWTAFVQPSATTTPETNQDAPATPPDAAQPCQCDLCREHQAVLEVERCHLVTAAQSTSSPKVTPPPEKPYLPSGQPSLAGIEAISGQASTNPVEI